MKLEVKCSKCGTKRDIIRQSKTPKDTSFYCSECRKMVKPLLTNPGESQKMR